MNHFARLGLHVLIIAAFCYFAYLMLLITIQYLPANPDVAFLVTKDADIKTSFYLVAFFTHVYTSIFVLLFGFLQFSQWLRLRYRKVHKNIGKAYVGIVLVCAAPSGLVMGYFGNGGFYSQISFCMLAILWFYFTLTAFNKARGGKFAAHRNYMILSYALTLSAISLRLFKWIIIQTIALPPMDTYRIVVWLGWLFNLFVALLVIRRKGTHAKA